ncbi:type III secretion system cytoplasmic ring protein SctQ [Caballeronia sp. LZ035]|uniref:type III secretion system cytoplasmic ring protein SctQ n=1 Tax=Caballeronia sp. LZ035 TaxID=3038568 RepID=UPI0028566F79|nr:type III secretion system cytoplasmic ring protein SctQ [Caballeronia sp. LZ035]MDR5759446.1 type III secretion system cytoplasmic ring protein SctQ [Caballeronia sp. LZ035]
MKSISLSGDAPFHFHPDLMAIAFNESAALDKQAFAASHEGLAAALRRVPEALAQASRVLFDARTDALALQCAGVESWQLSASASEESFAEPGRIVLTHVAGTLAIDLDLQRYPALRILAASAGAEALRQALAAALLAPLTEALLASGTGTWRVAGIVCADSFDTPDDTLSAGLELTFNARRHRALIHATPAVLALFERRIRNMHPVAPGMACRVPGRIAIGARRVAIDALEALRPGDVLLRTMPVATETALRQGDAFTVRAAWGTPGLKRLTASAQMNGGSLAITEDPIMTDETHFIDDGATPLANSPNAASDVIEIGELDLPVQFELDSVALPLAQLSSLRAGYVIELDTPVEDARIRLVAHGQTIGFGELISVAEHLGIRIVSMAHGDGSVR